ncbi:MAG: hypothetical protein ACF8Q5_06330 [Phycisphaerales bacterium JB040]
MDDQLVPVLLPIAQSPPEGAWVPMLGAFAAGLVLWILGSKVLRPAFAILGGALGGFAGLVITPLTGLPAFDVGSLTVQPQVLGMLVGGLIGVLVAVALFKFIVTIGSSLVFAAAGVLAGLIYIGVAGAPAEGANSEGSEVAAVAADETRDAYEGVREELRRIGEGLATDGVVEAGGDQAAELGGEEARAEAEERLRDAAEASKEFVRAVWDSAKAEWERRTPKERAIIFGGGAGGFLLGLIAGALFTRRATAVITALAGSAIWLSSGVALLRGPVGMGADWLPLSPNTWAVVWGGLAFIGLVIQLGVVNKKRETARGGDDDDDE